MFNIFGTKANPKGPNVNQLQPLNFDFVDSTMTMALPYGNCRGITNETYVEQALNIYDLSLFEDLGGAFHNKIIVKRYFEYSRFNWPGFGGLTASMIVFRVNHVDNLLDDYQLISTVKKRKEKKIEERNQRVNSDGLKDAFFDEFQFCNIGQERALHFSIKQNNNRYPRQSYCMAISPQHYVEFIFGYGGNTQHGQTWLTRSQALEKQILSSIRLTLNDRLNALRVIAD